MTRRRGGRRPPGATAHDPRAAGYADDIAGGDSDPFGAMADRHRRRRRGDLWVTLACLAWLALSGWLFLGTVPPEIFDNHTSRSMQDRMRLCEGNFQQRFACKQSFLLSGERWGFAVAVNRLTLICAPALTAWVIWRVVRRRIQ